jgi:ABC-type multidrug transport system fused ATPase/permease subunit
MVWRTSIVIAHRLSTIKHVDKIFVLKKWKIVEEWNYDELMNNKWEFFKLVNPDSLIIN